MSLTDTFSLRRRRACRDPAPRRPHDAPAAHRERPAPMPAARPARRLDRPQDEAFYTCVCGFAWTGAVTTSVGCPHCGTGQAW